MDIGTALPWGSNAFEALVPWNRKVSQELAAYFMIKQSM